MNAAERQALREKHRDNGIDGRCETCHYDTPIEGLSDISVCTAPPYPCDVIKVLDATEELKPNDLKTKVECTHIIGLMTLPEGWDVIEHGQTDFAFTYCPKCGEKLLPSCDHNETKTIETSFYYLNLPPVVMDCLYCVKCKMKL